MCVYLCVCTCMSVGVLGRQQRVLDPLELELQVIDRHLTWLLGTELGMLQEQSEFLPTDSSL